MHTQENKQGNKETRKQGNSCSYIYIWGTYFDSRTNAITPAVRGAEALVPVNVLTHLLLVEVVTYFDNYKL